MFASKMGFLQSPPQLGGPAGDPALLRVFRHGGNEGKTADIV